MSSCEADERGKNFPSDDGGEERRKDRAPYSRAGVLFLRYFQVSVVFQNDSTYVYCREHTSLLSAVAGLTVPVENPRISVNTTHRAPPDEVAEFPWQCTAPSLSPIFEDTWKIPDGSRICAEGWSRRTRYSPETRITFGILLSPVARNFAMFCNDSFYIFFSSISPRAFEQIWNEIY